jgi:hypothetical protein
MNKPLSKTESAVMALSVDAIAAGVRRVSQTHDGRKIGDKEPLDPNSPLAGRRHKITNFNTSRNNGAKKANASIASAQQRSATWIAKAQKQSATKRAKGKGKRHG